MENDTVFSCCDCLQTGCNGKTGRFPDFCLSKHLDPAVLSRALAQYEGEERRLMQNAALTECEGYGFLTRVQEIMMFAEKMGYRKLGVATCVGLIRETNTLAKVLRYNGFEVYAVSCKCGMTEKVSVGIDPVCAEKIGPMMCNPILQAELLKEAGTEFNVVMGLCVGHDSLFYKHSHVFCTTLVAKDRVTGHNPAAPLYQADGYYKKKLFPPKERND